MNPLGNIFKTALSRTLTYFCPLQNRIYTKLAIHLRYKHSLIKNTINAISNSGACIRDTLFAPVQCEKNKRQRKVSIIGGGGQVGQIIAYDLLLKRFCDEIVLYDIPSNNSVYGVALDMLGGVALRDHPKIKVCNNGELTKDSDILIICSGKGVAKGQTRLDALQTNVEIFRGMIPKLTYLSPKCVMLIVSNPVDIMAYVACKFSGFPFQRVLGTGTELDTSRFKFYLSKRLGISPNSINAWVIGEHGLSCVPCWSTINVAGTRLRDIHEKFGLDNDPEHWSKLEEDLRQNANNVKALKGFTCYSIAMTTSFIAQAILSNARTLHAVSTCCNGIHGFKVKSFMSLPAVVGSSGVTHIIKQALDCEERKKLIKSAGILDKALASIKW